MPTCEVLDNALDPYDGSLLLVSHDRYFLDQVVDELLVIRPAHLPGVPWKMYKGSYSDYLASVSREKAAAAAQKEQERKEKAAAEARAAEEARKREVREKEKAGVPKAKPVKVNMQKFAKMSMEQIEKAIANFEETLAHLEGSFANPKVAANPQAMKELKGKYEQAKKDLAEHMAAWEMKGEQ